MYKSIIECLDCGGEFEHFSHRLGSKRKYCNGCKRKRHIRVTKKSQGKRVNKYRVDKVIINETRNIIKESLRCVV